MENNTVLETFSPKEYLYTHLLNNIAFLTEENINKGTFPFTKEPYQKNRNVISGHTLTSIQESELELTNSLTGNFEQKWIFAADSADLSLELKDENLKPVIIAANTPSLDYQCAYPINYFTEQSIINCLNKKPSTERQKVLQSLLTASLTENNISAEDLEIRKCRQNNFVKNYSTPEIKFKTKNTVSEIKNMLSLEPEEQKIFYTLHKYFSRQLGCNVQLENLATDSDFRRCLENLGSENFAKLIFFASSYTERLTHIGFSTEPVYSLDNPTLKQNRGFSSPKAAAIGDISFTRNNKLVSTNKKQNVQHIPEQVRSSHNDTRSL